MPNYLMENQVSALRFLYQDQTVSIYSKYLCVYYQGVICMCGGDINPSGSFTIFYAGFGVLLASYINAKIFGEYQIILAYLYKEDSIFQKRLAKMCSAMKTMNLP